MATNKVDLLLEGEKRGILAPEQQALLSEARKRGMVEQSDVQQEPQDVDFNVGTMVSNLPSSAANVGKDMATAVMKPVDTAVSIGNLANSAVEKIGRKFSEITSGETIAPKEGVEEPINAVGTYVKDRYGSMDGFKTALMEDPAGVLLDFSTFAPTKIPVLAKVAKVAEPVNLGFQIGKEAVRRIMPESAVTKLYQCAAKFSTTLPQKQRASMIRTALDNGIMPTSKGVVLVEDRISILNNMLEDLVGSHVAAGTEIPVNAIFKHFKELRKQKGGVKIEAAKDLGIVDKVAREFVVGLRGRKTITVKELQEFKKDVYQKVNWNARKGKGTKAKEDTLVATGRGAKDIISEEIPGAAEINKSLGELYDLQPHLVRSANRIENNNIVSLGGGIKMGSGGMIGAASGNPIVGVATGVLAHIISTPKMKARLSLAINKIKKGDSAWLNNNSHWPEVRVALALAGRSEQAAEEINQGNQ